MSGLRARAGIGALVCLFLLGVAHAEKLPGEWPQYRGPLRDGKSTETGLLAPWPEGGPEDCIEEAMDTCPVECIHWEED